MMAVDSGSYTPETIARRLKMAEALLAEPKKPITHWAEGLNELAKGALGGYQMNRAEQMEREGQGEMARMAADRLGVAGPESSAAPRTGLQKIASLLGFGGAGAPAESAAAPAPAPVAPPAMTPPSTSGKVYRADEPSPLDPPSGKDRDLAIRTIYGEDPGASALGVANVIRNRAVAGTFGGDTPAGVVMAKGQFEPWARPDAKARMEGLKEGSPEYQRIAGILDQAYAGNDPTNGATHFFAPKVQAALGRPVPSWGQGEGQMIGPHKFIGGAAQPQQVADAALPPNATPAGPQPLPADQPAPAPTQQPQPAAAPPAQSAMPSVTDNAKQQIAAMLNSKNPYVRQQGVALANKVFEADAVQKPTDEMREYNLYTQQQKAAGQPAKSFFDYKADLKKAGAQNITIDQKGQSSFAQAAGSAQAKRFDELAGEAPKAKQMLADVEVLTDLGKNIGTGKAAEVKAALGPYAEALGIKIDKLDDIQAFEAVVNRMAPNLRVPGSGAQSDYELKNFLKSLPNLGNTEGGNEIAKTVMDGLYQNKIKAAEIGGMALNEQITRPEAEKMLRDLPDPMIPYREFMKKTRGAPTARGGTTSTGLKWSVE